MIHWRRVFPAQRRRAKLRGAAAAVLLLVGVLTAVAAGAAEPTALAAGPVSPAQWPNSYLAAPQIEGWPNALRISGPDRYQTSLAAALVLRGEGAFPFDTPDPSSGGVRSLAEAKGWWGLGVCPKAIIVVAGDSIADALAASALSDSTGRSTEPFLERIAAADPLFDPPGGFARVDTFAAPILLTPSARSGATSLAVSARLAAQDLRAGGCNTARQAIIVGGPSAVAPEIEAELVSIGYTEVFRVWGGNRYGTAVAVAAALGTGAVPPGTSGCADATTSDNKVTMGFWANSVVEWRPAPDMCQLLNRSVVLTDGVDGIDALASGWWTGYWQVPLLLHDGSDQLPVETATALSLLPIENIIVLGGTKRVPSEVVAEAARLARADTIRVSGPDRYATSVEMAKQFGGWWPTGNGADFAGSMLCVAGSAGTGRSARGSAEMLSAGPWCGTASGAVDRGAPARTLPPVNVARTALVAEVGDEMRRRPTREAVPILLVDAGAEQLPQVVESFLAEAFSPPARCVTRAEQARYAQALSSGACPTPGFAAAFGSDSVITPAVLGELSSILSGRAISNEREPAVLVGAQTPDPYSPFGVQSTPGIDFGVGAFATSLSMAPVYHDGSAAQLKVCMPRDSYRGARWVVVDANRTAAFSEIPTQNWYLNDSDGAARSPGKGAPACAPIETGEGPTVPVLTRAVGPSGATSDSLMLFSAVDRRFQLAAPIVVGDPSSVGTPSEEDPPHGGQTRLLFQNGSTAGRVQLGDQTEAVANSRIVLRIYRGVSPPGASPANAPPDTFTANWEIWTERGTIIGTAQGEALLKQGAWHLRGVSVLKSGTLVSKTFGSPAPVVEDEAPPPVRQVGVPVEPLRVGTSDAYGAGGFTATLTVNSPGTADDKLSWQTEAFINTPLPTS